MYFKSNYNLIEYAINFISFYKKTQPIDFEMTVYLHCRQVAQNI